VYNWLGLAEPYWRGLRATPGVRCSSSLGPDVKVDIVDDVSRRSIWETGERTNDTSMAIAIAGVAATGADSRDEAAQDAIVRSVG
jgi:hypothetical protein